VVLAVAGAFFVYAAKTADVNTGGSYELIAKFRKADGLSVGGDVRVSGVKVGSVRDVRLDPKTYQALVVMSVRDGVEMPEDSSAIVATDGLLGGAHITIQPGGAEEMLAAGDEFQVTQGSVSILDLVGKAISSFGGEK
jgi:phospholipid/cholesterol/gamma-HCH transport system substrate-binding protein